MTEVVDLDRARHEAAVRRGYRNWRSRFQEEFDEATRATDLSDATLRTLSRGSEEAAFYLYDLIMSVLQLGSGFEIRELSPEDRLRVMDRYLFVLDRLRFEVMRRLGWVDAFPGEDESLVELVRHYDTLAPALQAAVPELNRDHPDYEVYRTVSTFEKESFIRKMIPAALEAFSG